MGKFPQLLLSGGGGLLKTFSVSSVQLRKRKYEELPDANMEVLKKLKVSRHEYSAVVSANATPETLSEGNSSPVQPTATSASDPLSDIKNTIDA